MRLLPTLLSVLFSTILHAQTNQTVTLNGIGDIKVGMNKEELEKLTGKSIKLVHLVKKEDWQRDTFNIVYKDISCQVIMDKDYMNEKSKGYIVYEVKSKSPQLKTKSGISIGDDKLKIISTYEGYMMQITPEFENDYTTKSKTRSTVWLFSDEGKVIIFYLTNNKVTGFAVMYNEGC